MWWKCRSYFYCSPFTLCCSRKGGTNKLLRVLGESGWHGFAYPLAFPSVPALVEYYREKSLAEYNPSLDIRLLLPVPDPKKVRITENGECALKCGRLLNLSVCTAVQLKQKIFVFYST